MSVHFMSEKQDWVTPQAMIDWLVDEGIMERPTFDVAAAPHNTKAPEFFTIEDNALEQDWPPGILWCNPPFGKELKKFIVKALDELWSGRVYRVWFFVPARLDTGWFHDLVWPNADIIYFLRGRVNFLEHGKDKRANAPFPNMLFSLMGPNLEENWYDTDPIVRTLEPTKKARGR
jgi:phage N-6-adenine-methyltransferase